VVVALLVSASLVIAAGRHGPAAPAPGGFCGPGMGPGCAAQLGLTADQVKQMQQLRDEFATATKSQRDQIQAKAKDMAVLWSVKEPDAAAIKTLAGEIDGIRAEIRDIGIDYMIKAHALLTPAQLEKLQTMLKNCGGCCMGMGCGMGMGMGAGMGPGANCPMGMGGRMGGGMGRGMGPGTGPRATTGTCPLAK